MSITKWGFGAAPFKPQTEYNYKKALHQVSQYISDNEIANGIEITNELSVVKGLLNRIIKQNQWDWFTVYMYLDYPPYSELNRIIPLLSNLRTAILDEVEADIVELKNKLMKTNYCEYANNFLCYQEHDNFEGGYIYILSRKEEKELLKIGMTNRNVIKRCQEINSATGVLYPFSPRAVFRVTNTNIAEKVIHNELESFRVRADREFFSLSYNKAYTIIEQCLEENKLMYYKD